jgi:hypothetical protein
MRGWRTVAWWAARWAALPGGHYGFVEELGLGVESIVQVGGFAIRIAFSPVGKWPIAV